MQSYSPGNILVHQNPERLSRPGQLPHLLASHLESSRRSSAQYISALRVEGIIGSKWTNHGLILGWVGQKTGS